ncbi:twin-arginine translocation signal domain-containing protein [Streptomyces sp. NPDC001340]
MRGSGKEIRFGFVSRRGFLGASAAGVAAVVSSDGSGSGPAG